MPRRAHDDDEDDFEDDRPSRRKPRKKQKKAASNKGLLIALAAVGGTVLLAGTAAGVYFLTRDKKGEPVAAPEEIPGILAHWSFDGNPPTKDQTGRGNDGEFVGGAFAVGKKGNAYVGGGRQDQLIDLGYKRDLNFAENGAFTVAAWYQTPEKEGTILSLRHTDLPGQVNLFMRDNHALGIVGDDTDTGKAGTPHHAFCWCHPVNDGKWHHVALMRYESTIEIYYDGVKQGSDTQGACRGRISTNICAIGCELKFVAEGEPKIKRFGFQGAIDEVYVINHALKAEELAALLKR